MLLAGSGRSFFQLAAITGYPVQPGLWAWSEKCAPLVRPNTPIASTHSRPWREITVVPNAHHTAAYRIEGKEVAR
jgi:hypothetical protein